mmetsp:Transcript_69518/g.122945  ORF Transcript_69518/g.122945 Transcript_69518/m.122945 type:complete len:424 (+) Transcript_69518:108-1379(+)|eukprot:CAMPEP_0197632850 /NCGR_PEP_ID=MMETSP1338-20131121/9398_1 /TAXON_ID=43686 ORGANISM="Pelagodinium beii, Strain RCC1491" /NCGR_SAMPLE_ID=MMETSP1338 /ASSEMBLY_ACC=CAM_ASM_000754 /LENGTH=423 /DNA_ID=CAMNT_0043204421 /DNA_START=103 /DNA_END=1374 /DNA_ORIENTATION=-
MANQEGEKPRVKGAGIRSALRRTREKHEMEEELGNSPMPVLVKPEQLEPGQMPSALIKRCRAVAQAELAKLPLDPSEVRIARRRLSRSQSEVLLKQGMSLEGVIHAAAHRVIENWIPVLQGFVSRAEIPHVIAAMVHGEEPEEEDDDLSHDEAEVPDVQPPSSTRQARPSSSRPSQDQSSSKKPGLVGSTEIRRHWPNLKLPEDTGEEPDQHPVPPLGDRLGAAIRQVVPQPVQLRKRCRRQEKQQSMGRPSTPPWEFLSDMLKVADLEASFGRDFSWPDSAERKALRRTGGIKIDRVKAPCFAVKEEEKQAGGKSRRAPLSVDLSLRLSGDQSWADYRRGTGARATFVGFEPRVFNSRPEPDPREVPGPDVYGWPGSPMKPGKRGQFESVGKPRSVLAEASLSQSDRFFFVKGDPRYRDPAP